MSGDKSSTLLEILDYLQLSSWYLHLCFDHMYVRQDHQLLHDFLLELQTCGRWGASNHSTLVCWISDFVDWSLLFVWTQTR